VGALLGAVLLIGVPGAGAQSTEDRQRDLQAELNKLSQEQKDANAKVLDLQDKKSVIDARVAELDQQLAAAEAKLKPLADEANRIGTLVRDLQARIDVTQAQLNAAQAQLNASVAEMYRSARGASNTPLGFRGTPNQYVTEQKYLQRISQDRDDLVARVTGLRDDLDLQKRGLKVQQDKADAAANAAKKIRDEVAALRKEVEPARASAASQEANLQRELDRIRDRYGDAAAELASYQAANDSIASRLRAKPEPGKIGGCDVRPVNVPINSPFGPRWGSVHPGVDMAAPMGTPIRACRAGLVVISGWQGGYGNAVVIDHGGGMATLYGHQSQLIATAGMRVKAGDVIGLVGSTGNSTGPHLHFEVRLSGNVVDPENFI
jgi:murein DD-endopeptidase MepM/ murein hydrolase activator NlpD